MPSLRRSKVPEAKGKHAEVVLSILTTINSDTMWKIDYDKYKKGGPLWYLIAQLEKAKNEPLFFTHKGEPEWDYLSGTFTEYWHPRKGKRATHIACVLNHEACQVEKEYQWLINQGESLRYNDILNAENATRVAAKQIKKMKRK